MNNTQVLSGNVDLCYEKLRKAFPAEIKWRIEACKLWTLKQTSELTKKVGDNPDEFVE